MRLNFLIPILLVGTFSSFAQSPYFQQQADYRIDVRLNDQAHVLHGHLNLIYHNNAPEALDTLYFHLWPNAYRNQQTAYAKQARRMGETDFHFARKDQLGGIDSLSFTADGEAVTWSYHPEHIDIAILVLPQSLPPDAQVEINTPFRVDLPYIFSRLGHVNQSYSITQWYPKPAVYDNEGWHPMPYLDMGEFYSEFGNYEVSITLPENYQVGATGTLQNEAERERLLALSRQPLPEDANGAFPPSAKAFKTLMYTAENVHDFAWFADKRFQVRQDTATLPSGKTVEAWAFFAAEDQDYWDKGAFYVKRALEFYSEKVGEYPYPQATAVQTTLGAGGGMEYPMVTNIGGVGSAESLDMVITHEVGHNWFYGILASNERDHAWMDEGLNSYYEERYRQAFYPQPERQLPRLLMGNSGIPEEELPYLIQARRGQDQAPDTPAEAFNPVNYYIGAYQKPAQSFRLLEGFLGKPTFDQAMQAYYKTWQFRHPKPGDLRKVLEAESQTELSWLFDGLIGSNAKVRYKIKSISSTGRSISLTVRNNGQSAPPLPIGLGTRRESISQIIWKEGFTGTKTFRLPNRGQGLMLDPERRIPMHNRRRTANFARPFHFKWLAGVPDDERPTLFWSPLPGYNYYDQSMAGLLLHNVSPLAQKLEWMVMPFYSTKGQTIVGLLGLRYNFFHLNNKWLQRTSFAINARQFGHQPANEFIGVPMYQRLAISASLNSKPLGKRGLTLNFKPEIIFLDTEASQIDPDFGWFAPGHTTGSGFYRFSFEAVQKQAVRPFRLSVIHDGDWRTNRLHLSFEQTLPYCPTAAVDYRFFAGYRWSETTSPFLSLNLIPAAGNDFFYDELYIDRQNYARQVIQQTYTREGGFRSIPPPRFFRSTPPTRFHSFGQSNHYILSLNLKAGLPRKMTFGIPIKPYFDIGIYDPEGETAEPLVWSGGVMLDIADETLAIYCPLVFSSNYNEALQRLNFRERISFQINLLRLNPMNLSGIDLF